MLREGTRLRIEEAETSLLWAQVSLMSFGRCPQTGIFFFLAQEAVCFTAKAKVTELRGRSMQEAVLFTDWLKTTSQRLHACPENFRAAVQERKHLQRRGVGLGGVRGFLQLKASPGN